MQYTREELSGVRKYKKEVRARRRKTVRKVTKTITRLAILLAVLLLIGKTLSLLGISNLEEASPLDKYPTPQSYVDYLNSLDSTDYYLTVEDVYGNNYESKEVK